MSMLTSCMHPCTYLIRNGKSRHLIVQVFGMPRTMQGNIPKNNWKGRLSHQLEELFQGSYLIDRLCHNKVCASLDLFLIFLNLAFHLLSGHVWIERTANME